MNHLTPLYLLLTQGLLGAFDTLWYHEYQQRLPRDATARVELRLHAARDAVYTLVFAGLAWAAWHGAWAWAVALLLATELAITLQDFVEEDLTRQLPAGERVMHTVMAIVYGAFLAHLLPELLVWGRQPTAIVPADYGWLSRVLTVFAAGVGLSGVRDLAASFRRPPEKRKKGKKKAMGERPPLGG